MWIFGFGDVPLAILLAHDGTVITMERQIRPELFDSQINSHRSGIGLFASKGCQNQNNRFQNTSSSKRFANASSGGLGFLIIPSISLVIKCPSSPLWFTDVAIMAV
ncbi:hypothetical protein PAAG_08492 [Paracoccidioides lutzii Pb01]|uniref:Uncharacterized protein n=1 Tax=Paracoccidioides lutzii (strain ATCC MYA-826 / Pb01) TaxID=502779 RepID=C1HCK1_PARBA|nr:hypothetical protein PAAG_08492 [Paracoccidioides lutzii Pb01]EEH38765.2 hypothetical protein PAAG_08492 [Paracoccidioides lutzii Pb01]